MPSKPQLEPSGLALAFLISAFAIVGCGDDPEPFDGGLADAGSSDAGDGGRTTDTDGGAGADAGVTRDAGPTPLGPIVINEVMYHPVDTDGAAEFIELFNSSAEPVALVGWGVRGIGFVFDDFNLAPGEFVVVAEDASAFQAVYGTAPGFVTTGRLRNSGELLELVDATGAVIDRVEYDDRSPWPVTPDGEGPSLELINPRLDNGEARAWGAGGPTPGRANDSFQMQAPPYVVSVEFTKDPAVNAPVSVAAQIEGATSARLQIRIGFDPPTMVTMTAAASSYTAEIPGQAANALIRFRVIAQGPSGEGRWPRDGDSVAWDGTVVRDPSLNTALPVLHWFMHPDDFRDARFGWFKDDLYPAVYYYDGVLFDGARTRIKGDSSRQFTKNNWKVKLPRGRLLYANGLTPLPVDQFNLQSSYADKSYLRDVLSYRTWTEAGMPSNAAFSIRVQQNGEFFGLYTFVEDLDRDYLRRHSIDTNGAWYECNANGSPLPVGEIEDSYEKNTRPEEGHDDLAAFLLAMDQGNADRHTYVLDNVDVPTMINYLAVNVILHNNDQVAKNYYLHRDSVGTGRWRIMPWDMDLTFGRNSDPFVLGDTILADDDAPAGVSAVVSPSHPLFGDRDHQKWDERWNRLTDAMHADVTFRAMFFRRLRSVMDRFLLAGAYEQWITDYVLLVAPDAALDAARWKQWGMTMTHADAVSQIVDDYLPRRRTHLFATHRVSGEIPEAQSAAPDVVINELHYAPIEGDGLEFVELFNPSATESVDLSSWRLVGVDMTVPAGTVLLPGAYAIVVKDDATFRATRGGGRLVPGQYAEVLDDAGETIALHDRDGRVVDTVPYISSAPWPDAAGGYSIELIDVASDHSAPASWALSTAVGGTPGTKNSASP